LLLLTQAQRAQIEDEARAAYPRECCGLIEGVRGDGGRLRVTALHKTDNRARDDDRFEIDPAMHIQLARALRGTVREIIGCYHSHPGGLARPSGHDGGVDFVWLIAALDAHGIHAVTAHVPAPEGWRKMAVHVSGSSSCA
jgi:proteasome lid subunit RPN8/RPN11